MSDRCSSQVGTGSPQAYGNMQAGSRNLNDCWYGDLCQGTSPLPKPVRKCPDGLFMERVRSVKPNRHYSPPTTPFHTLSSNREHFNDFTGRMPDRVTSYRPRWNKLEELGAPMDGWTTYRAAYLPKPMDGYQKPFVVKPGYHASSFKMDGISTYRNDYEGLFGEKAQTVKPLTTVHQSTAKLDGATTYQRSFVPFRNIVKQESHRNIAPPAFSTAGFGGLSTYRAAYWPKCCVKRKSMRPRAQAPFSEAKYHYGTIYRKDYIPFYFDQCTQPCEFDYGC